jgi:hypothetical protein
MRDPACESLQRQDRQAVYHTSWMLGKSLLSEETTYQTTSTGVPTGAHWYSVAAFSVLRMTQP